MKLFLYVLIFVVSITTAGCGVHYYDAETGVDHIWGIGHLKMKTPPFDDDRVILKGVDIFGVGLGLVDAGGGYLSIGYNSMQSIRTVAPDAAVKIIRPTNDFFTFELHEFTNDTNVKAGKND